MPTPVSKVPVVVSVLVLALLLFPVLAASQTPTSDESAATPGTIEEQLVRLNRTLERIAALLERQLESDEIDLTLKRIEMGESRISSLEDELADARSRRTSTEDEIQGLRMHLQNIEQELATASAEELEGDRSGYDMMTRQATGRLGQLENRLQETEARIYEIENELTRRRADLRSLQEAVDRRLQ